MANSARQPARASNPDAGGDPQGRGLGLVLALLVAALWLWPLPLGLLEPWTGGAVLPHAFEDGSAEVFSRSAWELDAARRSWLGQGALFRPNGTVPFPPEGTQLERHRLLPSLLSLPLSPFGSAAWRTAVLALGVGIASWIAARRALRELGAGELGAWWGAGLYVLAPWFAARLELGATGMAWPWLPWVCVVLARRSDELEAGERSGTWRHGAALGAWLGLAMLTDWAVFWATLATAIALGLGLAWQRRRGEARPIRGRGTAPWASWPLAVAVAGALAMPLVVALDAPDQLDGSPDWTRLERFDEDVAENPAVGATAPATWIEPWMPARLQPLSRPPSTTNASLGFRAVAPYRELSLGWGVLALALWSARRTRGRALAAGGAALALIALLGGERSALASAAWIELWPAAAFLWIAGGSLALEALTRNDRGPKVVLGVAAALAWFEYLPAPVPTVRGSLPAYASAIEALPGEGAVLQLPWTAQPGSALLAQAEHRRPLFCAPLSSAADRDWRPLAGLERVIERYPSFAALLSGQALAEPEDLSIDLNRADVDLLVARRAWLVEHPDLWDLIDGLDGWATEESPMWVLWYRAPSGFQLNAFAVEAQPGGQDPTSAGSAPRGSSSQSG